MRCAPLVLAAVLGCKADAPEAKPAPAPASGAPARPAAADAAAPPEPVAQQVPTVDGAKLIVQRVRDDAHALTTWCIDEHDAIERVTAALRREGWDDVRTRGQGERIGIAAARGDVRFSATAGGRDERCAGTLIHATVMRLGALHIPPVEDRIR